MLILAVDTTSEAGGAAIFRDRECLARIAHEASANKYSVALFEMVERLVAEAGAKPNSSLSSLADIELYAVANGPGSFTGIRVGLAAVQAWAKVFEKPAKGVSVLEALAEAAQPATEQAVAILNAYRGEFYVGQFRKSADNRWQPTVEGTALNAEAVKALTARQLDEGSDCTWVAREHDRAALGLRETLPEGLRWQTVEGTLLDAIARIGLRAAHEGKLDPLNQLDAYYIRRTDAEMNWKE